MYVGGCMHIYVCVGGVACALQVLEEEGALLIFALPLDSYRVLNGELPNEGLWLVGMTAVIED